MGKRNTELENTINKGLWRAISRARKRGWSVNIDAPHLAELWHKQRGLCALSGLPLQMSGSRKAMSLLTWSLDRIDSTKGYTKGNVRIVCMMANVCKSDNPDDVVFEFARRVVKYAS